VLEALRAARGGASESTPKKGSKAKAARANEAPEAPTVKLGKVKAADYDRPREALPSLHFRFDEPVTHGAVLRQLGAPEVWEGDTSPADVLAPLLRAAAETARRIAMAEPNDGEEACAATPKPGRAAEQRAGKRRGAA
jgi:hypothetical protein